MPAHKMIPSSYKTINDRLVEVKFRPSGFDYMRIILALSVIGYHSVVTSYGWDEQQKIINSPWRPIFASILPMFFALSGFLVAGSLERSKLITTFLGLRVIRIMPALSAEVLITALMLGPLFTTVSLHEYFTSPVFYSYFWNIIGDIHFLLPGVFANNPMNNTINGQLWTVPWELACYLLLTALALSGIFRNRNWLLFFMVGCYAAHFLKTIYKLFIYNPPYEGGAVHGHTLLMIFAAGLLIYRFRDKIMYSGKLCILCIIITVALLAIPPLGDGFIALPVTYATCYLGLLNPRRNKLLLSGDYSYGIFLYGFPVQQAIASFPALRHWELNLLISIPSLIAIAVCSWWCIEKPALNLRVFLKKYEEWYLARRNQRANASHSAA